MKVSSSKNTLTFCSGSAELALATGTETGKAPVDFQSNAENISRFKKQETKKRIHKNTVATDTFSNNIAGSKSHFTKSYSGRQVTDKQHCNKNNKIDTRDNHLPKIANNSCDIASNFVDGDTLNKTSITKTPQTGEIAVLANTTPIRHQSRDRLAKLTRSNRAIPRISAPAPLVLKPIAHIDQHVLLATMRGDTSLTSLPSKLNTASSSMLSDGQLSQGHSPSRQLGSSQASNDIVASGHGFMDKLMAAIYNKNLASIDFLSVSFFISGVMLMIFLIHMT